MQVVNCTTPANFFHVLRRQLQQPFQTTDYFYTKKFICVIPAGVSPVNELTTGNFKEVIDDATAKPSKIKKVVFCTGKIYYDLLEEKEKIKNETIAVVRDRANRTFAPKATEGDHCKIQ